MVNVLVVGLNTPLGEALASSLLRSGDHRVHTFATADKTAACEGREIVPILCESIQLEESVIRALCIYSINVVVDLRQNHAETHKLLGTLKAHRVERIAEAVNAGVRFPKLGFIYVGTTWVHGSSSISVNDLALTGTWVGRVPPTEVSKEVPALEQAILNHSEAFDVTIIRPGLVYGRSSSMWTYFFQAIQNAAERNLAIACIPAELTSRPVLIHEDDVATGIHAAIDKVSLISGTGVYPVFDLVTSQESMAEILYAAARELGFKGLVSLSGCGNDTIASSLCCNGNLSSGRAKTILGWEPKRFGFVQAMDVYARAWLALQGEKKTSSSFPDPFRPAMLPDAMLPNAADPPMIPEGSDHPMIPEGP